MERVRLSSLFDWSLNQLSQPFGMEQLGMEQPGHGCGQPSNCIDLNKWLSDPPKLPFRRRLKGHNQAVAAGFSAVARQGKGAYAALRGWEEWIPDPPIQRWMD